MKALMLLLSLFAASIPAQAHEMRPILLQIEEGPQGQVTALLKLPVFRDTGMAAAQPIFPDSCEIIDSLPARQMEETVTKIWHLQCGSGLENQSIAIEGFSKLSPDALVLVQFLDGTEINHVLSADRPSGLLRKTTDSDREVHGLLEYIPIGIEHILIGLDHLLFLIGLMLVIWRTRAGWRMLVATVTAFTISHSITLGMSILGGVSLPSATVETLIALSVLILATELARSLKSPELLTTNLTFRKPWLVAFIFGLLHGFGFAGVLADIGLPTDSQALALLLFNIGVELGQLFFIAGVVIVTGLLSMLVHQPVTRLSSSLNLALGAIAAAWVLERLPAVFSIQVY